MLHSISKRILKRSALTGGAPIYSSSRSANNVGIDFACDSFIVSTRQSRQLRNFISRGYNGEIKIFEVLRQRQSHSLVSKISGMKEFSTAAFFKQAERTATNFKITREQQEEIAALAFKAAAVEARKDQGQEDDEKKAAENQIRALKYTMYAMGSLILGTGMWIFFGYGAPTLDQKGNPIRDEYSDLPMIVQYWKRSSAEVRQYIKYIVNPSRDKLLPDPVKPPYHQPPYTLLIELTGILVHPEWTYKTGWRFKKRPGVDYFLNQLAGYTFEVVIYTHEPGMLAYPIVDALDPQGMVHYRLFRDSTKYEGGVHVKDLDKLNRDLSKVIIIDCNEKAIHGHRNNALVLPKWKGNDDDRALFDLAALLQTIGNSEVKDVRGVLEYYASYPDPIDEFRRKQAELAKQEQEAMKKADTKVGSGFNPTAGFLGALFRKS